MSLCHPGNSLVSLLLFLSADSFLLEKSSFTFFTKTEGNDQRRKYLRPATSGMT